MNLSNEVLFLLQGGAGAVSGYITNKYAVNMLFKEYEPFKIFNKVIIYFRLYQFQLIYSRWSYYVRYWLR